VGHVVNADVVAAAVDEAVGVTGWDLAPEAPALPPLHAIAVRRTGKLTSFA
jgi:hypothetical protein